MALSDSQGDTVQTYEYGIFGQVVAEDANHTNPYMFTGRRFDVETGLYYYRARYYNPYIGRFLQTDPVGYGAGMNLYAYCSNNPINRIDPSGLAEVVSRDIYMWLVSAVTGNMMVLPWRLDPEILATIYNLEAYFEIASDIPQMIMTNVPGLDTVLENVSPTSLVPLGATTAYLNVASTLIGALPGVLAQDTNFYRGFFEVYNMYIMEIIYDDGSVTYEMEFEYIWLEAWGLRSGLNDDAGYIGGPGGAGGYFREKDAFYATLRAMLLYDYWVLGLSDIPENWYFPGYEGVNPYWGPYTYDTDFYEFIYNFIYGEEVVTDGGGGEGGEGGTS